MKEPPKRQYRKAKVEPPPEELPRRLLTVQEAADRLRVKESTIRDYVRDGRLTAYRVGPKLLRLDCDQVESLIVRKGL